MKRKPLHRALRALAFALIFAWSLFPILLVVSASFKPPKDIFAVPPRVLFSPTLGNYAELFRLWPEFTRTLWNSLFITLGATLLTVVASALAGWVYSRRRGHALTASAFFMVLIRMFPPIVITLPLFPVVNAMRLNDTHFILVILYSAFFVSLGTWIMKAFIDQVPRELEEAAAVDGATLWQTLRRVVLPLVVPGMTAAAVFIFIFAWNEFLFAFVFTTAKAKTAPLIISEMLGSVTGVDWGAVFAAATIQLLPIIVFVTLLQRHLIAGLTAGATKG
ncbi:MAG TPA: carbohydrate ABC transporter permease [Ramlibacter sp.]|nr:carbohydrate ABC transporter permease [Ramlibacter sp.]